MSEKVKVGDRFEVVDKKSHTWIGCDVGTIIEVTALLEYGRLQYKPGLSARASDGILAAYYFKKYIKTGVLKRVLPDIKVGDRFRVKKGCDKKDYWITAPNGVFIEVVSIKEAIPYASPKKIYYSPPIGLNPFGEEEAWQEEYKFMQKIREGVFVKTDIEDTQEIDIREHCKHENKKPYWGINNYEPSGYDCADCGKKLS